jgi:SMI1 / KNR4 family (SUKH-1)
MTTDWLALYNSLEQIEPFGSRVLQPTQTMLDEFESSWSFRLPKSYRDFITVFGPGMLGEDFSIRAPGYWVPPTTPEREAFNWRVDLAYYNQGIRKSEMTTLFRDVEKIKKCVFFAANTGDDHVCWDPDDIRSGNELEYGVYALLRERNGLVLLAENFTSFIIGACFGTLWDQLVNPGQKVFFESLLAPKCFQPADGFCD